MKKTDCKIVEDLLPLYIDGVLSAESAEFVEEHLKTCPECAAKKEKLSAVAEPEADDESKAQAKILRMTKRRFNRKTAVICVVSVAVCAVIAFTSAFFGARHSRLYGAGDSVSTTVMTEIAVTSGGAGSTLVEPRASSRMPDGFDLETTLYCELPDGAAQSQYYNLYNTSDGYISFLASYDNTVGWYFPNYDFYEELSGMPTFVERARYVMEYDLSAVNVFSSSENINIASAVREMKSLITGSLTMYDANYYYPITGDLSGYALLPQTSGNAPEMWYIVIEHNFIVYEIYINSTSGYSADDIAEFLSHISFVTP